MMANRVQCSVLESEKIRTRASGGKGGPPGLDPSVDWTIAWCQPVDTVVHESPSRQSARWDALWCPFFPYMSSRSAICEVIGPRLDWHSDCMPNPRGM